MADYVLKLVDQHHELIFLDNRPVLNLSAPGPQGPPGLQNVTVSSTAPVAPNLYDIWLQVVA